MAARRKTAVMRSERPPAGWFWRDDPPRRPGIYETSKASIVHIGHARGCWDGKRWVAHRRWGDYSASSEMVWRGEGKMRRSPIKDDGK